MDVIKTETVGAVVLSDGSINIFAEPGHTAGDFDTVIDHLGIRDWQVDDWAYGDLGYTEYWRLERFTMPDKTFAEAARAITDRPNG